MAAFVIGSLVKDCAQTRARIGDKEGFFDRLQVNLASPNIHVCRNAAFALACLVKNSPQNQGHLLSNPRLLNLIVRLKSNEDVELRRHIRNILKHIDLREYCSSLVLEFRRNLPFLMAISAVGSVGLAWTYFNRATIE